MPPAPKPWLGDIDIYVGEDDGAEFRMGFNDDPPGAVAQAFLAVFNLDT